MKKVLLSITFLALSFYSFGQLMAPVLLLPDTAAINVKTSPDLDWRPALGGTVMAYELEVDTSSSFSNPIQATFQASGGSVSKLLFNQIYFWRVRAVGTSTTSPWSEVFSFTTYRNNFNLVAPADSAALTTAVANLDWVDKGDVNYNVQYDTSETFNSAELTEVTLINPDLRRVGSRFEVRQRVIELFFNQRYYWRVQAFHANDTSDWSDSKTFTTAETVMLSLVADGSTNVDIDNTLSAIAVTGADDYEMELDSSVAFNSSSKEFRHQLNSDPEFPIEQMLFGTEYFWRVRAVNFSNESEWSEVWSFTTKSTVTKEFPAANDVVTQTPEFIWSAMPGIELFQIEVDDNSGFTNPRREEVTGGVTEFTFTDRLGFGAFFWRVRAVSTRDTSDWSSPTRFLTTPVGVNQIDSKPELVIYPNPANDIINVNMANLNQQSVSVQLLDLSGRVFIDRQISSETSVLKEKIDVTGLAAGVYLLSINVDGDTYNKKLTIRR